MTATQAWIAGVQIVLSAIVIGILLWVNFGKPWRRSRKMREPFDVAFKLAPEADAPTGSELRLPAHTANAQMDLRIAPKLHFVQNEIIVGIGGDFHKRPKITKMRNSFVKSGKNVEGSPDRTEGHYIDYTDRYHVRERVDRTKGNKYAIGFIVETNDPGVFLVSVEAMTDDGEGKASNQLTLRIE